MTPQLVDHAHTRPCNVLRHVTARYKLSFYYYYYTDFLHSDWLQPRATSQENIHVYFCLQSHHSCITVAVTIVNNA